MSKFNVPKRQYCTGPKKMMSMRLPVSLLRELDKLAEEYGWTTTDLVTTSLDQFLQWAEKNKKHSKTL